MSKEIYSEGRVVGYSAYETYLKLHMSEFPDIPPASEKQWLAASLAMGSSLIVKIPADSTVGNRHYQIQLPLNTRLVAGNPIYGSIYLGDAEYSGSWATTITSYRGIDNTSSVSSPEQASADVDDPAIRAALLSYLKFHDWSVIFSQDWDVSGQSEPYYDLKPDFTNGVSYLNVQYEGPLESDVQVILTGFTSKCALSGVTGVTGSTNTDRPENGDFIGPEVFPWVAPVELVLPVEAGSLNIFELATKYWRKYPTTAEESKVTSDPVIDYNYTNPADMYDSTHHPDALTTADVTRLDFGADKYSKAVLMARSYDDDNKRPAALYGGVASEIGNITLGPLDTYAPNTVKLFESTADAIDYEKHVPYNFSLYRDGNKILNQIDLTTNTVVPVADMIATNNAVTFTIGNKSETINKTSISTATTSTTFVSGLTTATIDKVELSEANNSITITVGDESKTIPIASVTTAADGTTVVAGPDSAVMPTIKIEEGPGGESIIWIGGTSSVISSAQIGWTSNANATWTKVGPSTSYALSMATSGGSLYNLNGSSSTIVRPFTQSGGYYNADITWSDLVDMLHNNKKLRLRMTGSTDPTSEKWYNITSFFAHIWGVNPNDCGTYASNLPLGGVLTYGGSNHYIKLQPYGKSISGTDGSFLVALHWYRSDYSTASKVEMIIMAFLNNPVSYSGASTFVGDGFLIRGVSPNSGVRCLFNSAAPNKDGQDSAPCKMFWDAVPESWSTGLSELWSKLLELSSTETPARVKTLIKTQSIVGALDNDKMIISDTSFWFTSPNNDYIDTVTGNSYSSYTWRASAPTGDIASDCNNCSFKSVLGGTYYQ